MGRTAPNFSEQRMPLENENVEFKSNGLVNMSKYRWYPGNGYQACRTAISLRI